MGIVVVNQSILPSYFELTLANMETLWQQQFLLNSYALLCSKFQQITVFEDKIFEKESVLRIYVNFFVSSQGKAFVEIRLKYYFHKEHQHN